MLKTKVIHRTCVVQLQKAIATCSLYRIYFYCEAAWLRKTNVNGPRLTIIIGSMYAPLADDFPAMTQRDELISFR